MKRVIRPVFLMALCALLAATGIATSSQASGLVDAEFIWPAPDTVFQTLDSIYISALVWYEDETYGALPTLMFFKNIVNDVPFDDIVFYELGPDPERPGTYRGLMTCHWRVPALAGFNSELPTITGLYPVTVGQLYDVDLELFRGRSWDSTPIRMWITTKGSQPYDPNNPGENKSATATSATTWDNMKALYK